MALMEILKVTHQVEEGVKAIGDNITGVDNKVDAAIEGTLRTLVAQT